MKSKMLSRTHGALILWQGKANKKVTNKYSMTSESGKCSKKADGECLLRQAVGEGL